MRYPIPDNEGERLNALKGYFILDSLPEGEFDRITALASLICGTPISLISIVDENRQWFKSAKGLTIKETPRELAFCQYTIMETCLFEVGDATMDERFRESNLVTGYPYIRFYAGYPLVDAQGFALGTLCVIDNKARILTADQKNALALLAQEVVAKITERRQKEELKHFERLFHLSGDLLCIAGMNGAFRKVNPAFQKLLGREIESILGSSFFDLVHPDDREITRMEFEKLAKGQESVRFTHRFKTSSLECKVLQWTATPEISTGYIFAIARDITHQSINEKRLAISEERLRIFFESSLGLMCTHDLSGRFLSINAAGAANIGYTIAEMSAMSLYDFVPAANHALVEAYLKAIETTGSAAGKMPVKHKNGNVNIWMYNNVLEYDPASDSHYVIGNAIDITERQRLEHDLRRTTEMLEQTNRVARVGGWDVNIRTGEVFWTSETRAIHGVDPNYKPDLQSGINFYEEGESRDQIMSAVNLAISDGIPFELELTIINAAGRQIWVRAIGNTAFENGVCTRVFGTFQDIDEKKKAQLETDKSRKLLDEVLRAASAVAIMAIDTKGLIGVFNTGAENMLGYHSDEVVGKKTPALFHKYAEIDERRRELSEEAGHQVDEFQVFTYKPEREGAENREWTYVKKDGAELIVSLVVTAMRDTASQINGYVCIAIDITEREKIKDALVRAKELAEQASIAKSEFLTNMSHEIRTPLNGVIGFTDLVLKTKLDDTQRQYLSLAHQSANTLLGIINDILDFSKIEAGKLELEVEKFDCHEVCSQATDIIRYQVQTRGLDLLLHLADDLPRFMWADHVRLKQILVNLLGNAVKFTEKGRIALNVEVVGDRGHLKTIRFGVRDTGIGIKNEKQGKIFEAFSQEDGSTTKRYGGTGLGLTICNQLLGLMGSRLQLESTPGQGSLFYFEVTLRTEERQPLTSGHPAQPKETPQYVKSVEKDLRQLTVLIAEDNEINMLLSRQIVKRAVPNAVILEAVNGRDAVDQCAKQRPDIILMDMQMPEMCGYEATKKIREGESSGHIPIIALTAGSMKGEREKCLAAGMDDYVIKPVVEDTLAAIFAKWLNP